MVIQRLLNSCSDSSDLERFIQENFIEVSDKLNKLSYSAIVDERVSVRQLSLHHIVIGELDYSKKKNFSFLENILKLSVRLSDFFLFNLLYAFYEKHKSLHDTDDSLYDAASLILATGKNLEYYIKAFKRAIDILKTDVDETESTTIEKTNNYFKVSFVCSFYGIISKAFEFNPKAVEDFNNYLLTTIEKEESAHFLNCELLHEVLNLEIVYGENLIEKINLLVDRYFENNLSFSDFELAHYLIESSTSYSVQISELEFVTLNAIREISKSYHTSNDNDYYSLSRGIAVLSNQDQLHQYLFSYGKMHRLKLEEGLNSLPDDVYSEIDVIYDWGCGQGLGAVATLNKLKQVGSLEKLKSVQLIEPSNCAIRRAALHVSTYTQNYFTLNKDFDSLIESDFTNSNTKCVHIFSNIIDVELFSLADFIRILKSLMNGIHYFIIVSPSTTLSRTMRIDSFCEEMKNNFNHIHYKTLSKKRGGWIGNYTLELRAFSIQN